MTIVVATADFALYHELVTTLRERELPFTTVEPGDPLPASATVLLTGAGDEIAAPGDVETVVADPTDPRAAVEAAVRAGRGEDPVERLVVGIDPGPRPGIAVLSGGRVLAAYQVPLESAADVVREELDGAADPVVRIGDGARLDGARLIEALEDVRVELVDETGTTPHLGAGVRGTADALAAVNIALREGEPVDRISVEPTPGELQVIKDRSRARSPQNRAIDGALARRVALGELSIDDALEAHRRG